MKKFVRHILDTETSSPSIRRRVSTISWMRKILRHTVDGVFATSLKEILRHAVEAEPSPSSIRRGTLTILSTLKYYRHPFDEEPLPSARRRKILRRKVDETEPLVTPSTLKRIIVILSKKKSSPSARRRKSFVTMSTLRDHCHSFDKESPPSAQRRKAFVISSTTTTKNLRHPLGEKYFIDHRDFDDKLSFIHFHIYDGGSPFTLSTHNVKLPRLKLARLYEHRLDIPASLHCTLL